MCCWRYYESRQNATLFKTSATTNKNLESKFQVCITYAMLINYILTFFVFGIAFLVPRRHDNKIRDEKRLRNFYFLGGFLLYTLLFEAIVVIALNRTFHFVNNCSYLFLKLLSGLYRRTT